MLHRLLFCLTILSLPAIAWAQSPLDDLTEALQNYEPGTRVRVYRDGRTQVVSSD